MSGDAASGDRELVLGRIRAALGPERPAAEPADDRTAAPASGSAALLRERLGAYGTRVVEAAESEIADAVAAACERHRASRLVVPPGLPPAWLPSRIEPLDGDAATLAQLDAVDGALSGCAWAIAETGTIVLAGGPAEGRRTLSLIPDLHVCVVRAEQILADVPDLFAALGVSEATRPLTLVSGPSATSDIELRRVEGVHGPRRLEVVLAVGG